MHISSKAGTEIFKNEYQIIDGINGIPTLETDYSQLKYNHPEPMVMLSNAYDDRFIMIIKEQESVAESSRLRLTGVHSFIYDFSLDRIYEEYTQYFSLENILSLLFDDTDYTFEVKSDIYYYALEFQNFGDNDKMSLINQICDRWDLEYHVTGKKVVFGQKRGRETTKQFRYKMNIADSSVNLDISEGATYIRAYFGKKDEENPENSTYTEREMTHPLAEEFGIRHAEPYSNENITQEETMQRYMKMKIEETWKLSVEIDVTELIGDGQAEVGDTVWAIDERMDLQYKTRIIELRRYYNKDDEVYKTKAILGNKTFIEAVSEQEVTQSEVQEVIKYTNRAIETLKGQFDNDFNAERDAIRQMVSDATNAAHAEIQAAEQRMESLITTTRDDWTETFEAEVADIYRKADEDYNRIEAEISGTIDSTREEMEMNFSDSVQNARDYAELQAQEKATAVRTDLETVTSGHQQMLDDLETNVMNIDDFLGDKTVGLNELLYNERILFEERINSINTWHYNLLRETQSLDNEFWEGVNGTIETDSNGDSYYRSNVTNVVNRSLYSKEEILFEAGETYTLSFQVQTYGHRSMDYVWIMGTDSTIYNGNHPLHARADEQTADVIHWSSQYRTYYITFTMPYDVYGRIRIGGNYNNNELGAREYRIKKPYLTQSDNKQWLHNPEDSLQNLEEVTRRVTLLEDGREEFITKTQFDFETGEIEGTMRNILETVDGRESIIQNHEDWINTNGASVIESAEGFQSKAWLADIHNPNTMNFSDVTKEGNRDMWSSLGTISYLSSEGFIRMFGSPNNSLSLISPDVNLIEGETYTLTFESLIGTPYNLNELNQTFVAYPTAINQRLNENFVKREIGSVYGVNIYRYTVSFVARESTSAAQIYFGANPITPGQRMDIFIRKPKVELGSRSTPYENAFSNLTQRADEMMLAVQGIGEKGFLNQSDITIRPDYVDIGSQRLDGSNIGSILRVSPSGIDMVAEAMRLSGDLYVDGDITALAVDAIEGNFARLWADEFSAITITADHIDTSTLDFSMISGIDALIERLVVRTAFVNAIQGRELYFSDGTIGRLESAIIRANVIEAEHIAVGTALIDKMFATSARIDELITKTHFVNEIKATSIEAVHADLRSVDSEIMGTNILKAEWIQGGNALLDKVFANTAMFERMMAKSGFVRTLNTVTIDTDQLTIRRPDGVAWVSNGVPQFDHEVHLVQYMDSEADWTGQRYRTNSATPQIFSVAYTSHASRYLRFNFSVSMDSSQPSASTLMGVRISPGNVPSGRNWQPVWENYAVHRGRGDSYTLIMDLGRPTYQACSFTFEVWWESNSSTQRNLVQVRPMRCWMTG